MIFSERMGITRAKPIQMDSLDEDTRNSLWNSCRANVFDTNQYYFNKSPVRYIAFDIYRNFFKKPVDDLPYRTSDFTDSILYFFKHADWYQVFNLVEFIKGYLDKPGSESSTFVVAINNVLEQEKSGFRFVGGFISPITNKIEISEIESAARLEDRLAPIAAHINSALALFGRKPNPDYRNCVKEAISAVESASMIVAGRKATLGDALKKIEMHEAFRQSLLKLYGYTSDEGGIRHALSEIPSVDEADARYMLVACSACANFIISKNGL